MVVFLEDDATFRVPEKCPCDVAVFQLSDGDLTGEGTIGLVEDILCGDFNTGLEMFAGEE